MQALEDDKYVRKIQGYLPSASVAFIDEIFKVRLHMDAVTALCLSTCCLTCALCSSSSS